jgi:hypothetical protein
MDVPGGLPGHHAPIFAIMPGLVPGIHVLTRRRKKYVDGRDKPGHDVARGYRQSTSASSE